MNPRNLCASAERIARSAGELLLGFVGTPLDVRHKGVVDLVTRADGASEDFILAEIRKEFPDHRILAEESGGDRSFVTGETLWVVDPLDGTTNFAHGLPIWSISIAVYHGEDAIAAVVHDPTRGECFTAHQGGGAFLNDEPIHVSSANDLDQALLVTGFPYDVRTSPENNLDHFARLMLRSQTVRRLGSAALDFAYVAAGRFDGFWELKLAPWDLAAGMLLVTEAGGQIARFDGSPADMFTPEMVAGPPGVLAALRAVLQEDAYGPPPA